MTEKPYIGVSGIGSVDEAREVNFAFQALRLAKDEGPYIGMAGYLISYRVISQRLASRPGLPSVDSLSQLLPITALNSLNVLHYASARPDTIFDPLNDLLSYLKISENRLVEGIQFNIKWPSVSELTELHGHYPDLKVVLQIGPSILNESTPDEVAKRVLDYKGLVNYCLIDSSGGHGLELKEEQVSSYTQAVREGLPDSTLILAGGLNPDNVLNKIYAFKKVLGGQTVFGVDAQSGLRTDTGKGLDQLKVIKYLAKSRQGLGDLPRS